MSNEIIFGIHLLVVILATLAALRIGKEALIAWVSVGAVLANLFVLKQIDLLGMHVTASDLFAIGSILSLNLIQEYFGKKAAQKAIYISFFILLLFSAFSQIHLFYVPNNHDYTHGAYAQILTPSLRLLVASVATFYTVQQFDLRLFAFIKDRAEGAPFWIRCGISVAFCQALDTALFSYLGLFGLVSSIFDIMVVSFHLKLFIICLSTPFLALSQKIRKVERAV